MPSTTTLQSVVNWATCFVDFEELNIGTGNEPAITNANTVLRAIAGPPFKWAWNRDSLTFPTIVGTQDYLQTDAGYGFLEGASVTLGSSTYAIKEIKQELTQGSETGRPQSIAVQLEDPSANEIMFRLLPVPDAVYSITAYYQLDIGSLALATVIPIPDRYMYIFNYGFLALSMAYADDQRFQIFNQKFVAHLLGAQGGLTETERSMFLDSWNLITRQEALVSIKAQQARQALGT
jgi:hypothetical protein